ncbi:hypothetical protein K435DRAFT_963199 [Dendrothele bispora CBS 962.96]|uniref:Uncharacterized protein n=1 Tax=Dendrothele bispora (strain CBS 962.96) TaxID=1314807 RepID=A0A4S8MJF0_DENBC|nr:hypothetical protein K435DRAFT_963199 [Dendrothele bispora CBS 962.96]
MLALTSRVCSRSYPHLRPLLAQSCVEPTLRLQAIKHGSITRHFRSTAQSRSDSLLSRFSRRALYKKDGTPRSKMKGFVFGTLTLGLIFASVSVVDLIGDMEDMVHLLAALLQVQVIDSSDFSTTDFDSYKSTVSYFAKICKPVIVTTGYAPAADVDTFFEELRDLNYAEFDGDGEATKEKLHGVMREAAKEIHEKLLSSRDQPVLAIQDVPLIFKSALETIVFQVQAHFDEGMSEWLTSLKESENDRGLGLRERNGGYDIIG